MLLFHHKMKLSDRWYGRYNNLCGVSVSFWFHVWRCILWAFLSKLSLLEKLFINIHTFKSIYQIVPLSSMLAFFKKNFSRVHVELPNSKVIPHVIHLPQWRFHVELSNRFGDSNMGPLPPKYLYNHHFSINNLNFSINIA